MIEPWSKFFWSDYEADQGLRICSLAAQGLWMRMLCTMAEATPKGDFRIGDEPCSIQDLAKMVGESETTISDLLDELKRRGVFSVTRAGVIFNRRMRKDAEISRKRAEAGRIGGNASIGKYKQSQVCSSKTETNVEAKLKPQKPEARSKKERRGAGTTFENLPDWIPTEAWNRFLKARKDNGHPVTKNAAELLIAKLDRLRAEGHPPGDVLDQSTLNGWRGVFELKNKPQQASLSLVDIILNKAAGERSRV